MIFYIVNCSPPFKLIESLFSKRELLFTILRSTKTCKAEKNRIETTTWLTSRKLFDEDTLWNVIKEQWIPTVLFFCCSLVIQRLPEWKKWILLKVIMLNNNIKYFNGLSFAFMENLIETFSSYRKKINEIFVPHFLF